MNMTHESPRSIEKHHRLLMAIFAPVLLASGCATPYEKRDGKYGYDDFRIKEDVFEISFSGNARTAPQDVSRYVFRRASEVTLSHGFTHFQPMSEIDESTYGTVNQSSSSASTYVYHGAYSAQTYGSSRGASVPFRRPAIVMRIKCFGEVPLDTEGLVDAQQFLQYNYHETLAEAQEDK